VSEASWQFPPRHAQSPDEGWKSLVHQVLVVRPEQRILSSSGAVRQLPLRELPFHSQSPDEGWKSFVLMKDMMEKEVNGETLPKKIISCAPQYLAYHQVWVVRPEQRILSSPPERCLSRQRLPVHSHPPEGW
jgi:hypothetical protein